MKKRIVTLFLSLILVASMFTGCGNGSQSSSGKIVQQAVKNIIYQI